MSKEWSSWFFSGDVFVGRKGKDKNPHNMNMFGHFIVKAVFLQLIEDYKIDSSDTKVQLEFYNSDTTAIIFFPCFSFALGLDPLLTAWFMMHVQMYIGS